MIIRVEIEVERISGKFASREDVAQALITEIESVSLGGLGADGDSEYEIVSVGEYFEPKKTRVRAS